MGPPPREDVVSGNWVRAPLGVMRPILVASVNQRLLSGPTVIPPKAKKDSGKGKTVTVPMGVIRPILLVVKPDTVNHRFPSGPAVRNWGDSLAARPGTGNSVMVPCSAGREVGVSVGVVVCVGVPQPLSTLLRASRSTTGTASRDWRAQPVRSMSAPPQSPQPAPA